MKRGISYAVSLAAVIATGSGCGRAPGFYPVYGKVTYHGEPATGATVYFHRSAGEGVPLPSPPMGIVQDDGSFEVVSDQSTGAPVGSYHVLVEWRAKAPTSGAVVKVSHTRSTDRRGSRSLTPRKSRLTRTMPPDRLNGRYFAIEHPLLKAEVRPESNTLPPFELVD
jgi:hypothetical protein